MTKNKNDQITDGTKYKAQNKGLKSIINEELFRMNKENNKQPN